MRVMGLAWLRSRVWESMGAGGWRRAQLTQRVVVGRTSRRARGMGLWQMRQRRGNLADLAMACSWERVCPVDSREAGVADGGEN